jgi:hypothetical protein
MERIQIIVVPGELPRMTRQVIEALRGAGVVPGENTRFYDPTWLADQIEQLVDFRRQRVSRLVDVPVKLNPVGCPPRLISRLYSIWRDVVGQEDVL